MNNAVSPLFAGESEESLKEFFAVNSCPAFRANQAIEWFWTKKTRRFEDMANLPKPLRELLSRSFSTALPEITDIKGVEGGTRKFLSKMADGECVESVIIPAAKGKRDSQSSRTTLCVSSQIGCAFGCKFCASGLLGLSRNLEAGEITGQILAAEQITGTPVDNIVFMGMGEPLANYDNLIRSLDIITSPKQLNIGARHITISTSGNVPGIRKLAEYPKQIRLAISLHGATDEVREQIMPVNKKWPLEELKGALQFWAAHKKQLISLEYILIKGVNDSMQDAGNLIRFTKNLPVKINLIPYNTVEGLDWERPPLSHCQAFRGKIDKAGIPATMRYEKGHDIDAACGQLRLRKLDQ